VATLAELELRIKSLEAVKAKKNLDAFGVAVKKAAENSKKAQKTFEAKNKTVKKLNRSYSDMTSRIKGLVAGIGALLILRQATMVFADFEQTMAEVGGVTRATGEDFETLTKQARELGAVTRFSARQAADAQLALSRAGFTVNETLKTSRAVLDLASGAQLELGRSAEITAITLKQFRLEATEAVRVTDILVNTANSATTNVEGLAQAMKFSGAIAASFGKDLESTAAALGVIADSGLDASQAGTGLRGVFSRLGDPIGKAAATLDILAKRLGETRKIFDITENSLADIFQAFRDAGASTQDFIRIFGRLQAPAALALVANVEKIRELTAANMEAGGTAAELARVMNDTLKGSLLALKSAVEELFIAIGDGVLGKAFRALVILLRDTALAMSNFDDGTTKVSTAAKILAIIIKVLVASLAVYGVRLGVIALETAAAKAATLGFAASLKTLRTALISTGIGVAVVVVGELVAALSETNEAIDDIADQFKNLESSQKKSTIATKEQIKAIEDLNRSRLQGRAILQGTLDRFNDAAIKLRRLREGASIQDIKDLQVARDLLRVNVEAAKQKFGVTKLTARQQQDADKGTQQILKLEKALAGEIERQERAIKAAEKATKDRIKAQQELAKFQESQLLSVEESGLSRFTVQVERLQNAFSDLFLAAKSARDEADLSDLEFDELQRGIALIAEQQQEIGDNKALEQVFLDGEKAVQALEGALKATNDELEVLLAAGADRTRVLIQQEFAEASEAARTALRAMDQTPEMLIDGLVKINENLDQIAANRGLLVLVKDGQAAEQSMLELSESIKAAVDPLDEFKSLADTAVAGYRAQLEAGIIDQDAFFAKQRAINGSIAEFDQNLRQLESIDRLKDVAEGLAESFGNFFEEIITGSKTAGEAALDFFREISRLALRKLAIEPLVAALKAGIGSAIGGAAGGGGFLGSAQGNAFRHGNLQAFANGGIIGGPTVFPLGLAGEAGPEAILPLKRDSSGNLGVAQVDSRPQRRTSLRQPFVSASVSTGASENPSRQEIARGGNRIVNVQQNITTLDPNAFRSSSAQIQDDALRAARMQRF